MVEKGKDHAMSRGLASRLSLDVELAPNKRTDSLVIRASY